jgi:hypothetical protein
VFLPAQILGTTEIGDQIVATIGGRSAQGRRTIRFRTGCIGAIDRANERVRDV